MKEAPLREKQRACATSSEEPMRPWGVQEELFHRRLI
jgi:hypothetical protein